MNDALYWVMIKHESKKILGYALGLNAFQWLVTGVYPALVKSPVMEDIPKSFPSAVKRVFGVSTEDNVDLSYEAYISAQLFGRFWTLIISVYGISAANTLLAQLIDRGFMSFPLSAPIFRCDVLNTQIAVLLTELLFVTGTTIGGIYASTAFSDITINRWQYFRLGVLAFSLGSAISAYSLLLGTFLGSEEESLRAASVLTFVFYGLDVVSCLSDRFSCLKRFTPFGLFRPQEVLQGKVLPTKGWAVLSVISGLAFALANAVFKRKDLVV
jgi:ABC-2 type transport system permease protein